MGNYLKFDDIKTSDYDIEISGEGVFNAPARAYEMIDIPGRNGALAIDQGRYENIEVTYPAYNYKTTLSSFADNLRDLRNALASKTGYCRLEDTFHPNEYRMGIFKSGLEVDVVKYNTASQFELKFDCKPQRWLTIAEQRMDATLPGTGISTLTPFPAKPLIIIRYTRGATLGTFEFCHQYTVNVQLANLQQTPNSLGECELFIDCELMDAYEYETFTDQNENTGQILSANSAVTCPNGFPVIEPTYDSDPFCTDYTTVPNSGNIKGVYFIGRYWRI